MPKYVRVIKCASTVSGVLAQIDFVNDLCLRKKPSQKGSTTFHRCEIKLNKHTVSEVDNCN